MEDSRPYSRRSRSRPLVRAVGIEKAVIDRTDRLIPVTCMEVEDENDDEDENDWGRKQAGKATPPIDISRPSKIAVQTTQKSPLKPGQKIVNKISFKT
jgi:hypothetical protein